ncbi:hypothetical protein G6F59_018198 [Rhizopus arrhizus]|uniref:Uncharacterized protein n=1 Tax=Rhizopus delemar TaxID=936053 RepID=A0A9P6XSU1_9FUNG|nr:hypothetical protein G6F59_018198 [Rhizopus arrhizus]KAG1531752.1 hypothetical protein G6F50_016531 [Rhizopus delemar]
MATVKKTARAAARRGGVMPRADLAVRTAGGGGAVGTGHRRRRQQGHAPPVPGGQHAGEDPRAGRGRPEAVHRHHRPVQRQGEERDRHLRDPAGEAWRRSAA